MARLNIQISRHLEIAQGCVRALNWSWQKLAGLFALVAGLIWKRSKPIYEDACNTVN